MIRSIIFVLLLSISFANSSTVELTHKNFDKTIKENNKTVVMFSASWCNACESMKPIYQELSKDLDGVLFATIDTDKEQNISARYGIKSLPTTIVFENSKEIDREVGALNRIELTALVKPKIEENLCSATDKNSMQKCFDIAKMYRYQSTTSNADAKAFKFMNKLCNHGYMDGCLNMGYIYYHGNVLDKNLSKALQFFDKACKGGEQLACISIGIMYRDGEYLPQDVKKATEIFKKACDSGSDFGCYQLALNYENGQGIEQNGTKALLLQKRICDENRVDDYSKYESCTQVGQIYKYARGVEQNFSEALKYYKIACDRGSSIGCNDLGLMYGKAEGVERNSSMAIKLYTISCEADDSTGCYNLGGTYGFGWYGVQKDIDKGLKFLDKSCNLGDMEACYDIGKIYSKEKNNKIKAKEYFQYACDNGYYIACKKNDLLENKRAKDDKEQNRTLGVFIILFFIFIIVMHFKQKRVILENKESKITEEVPFLFSWSMVIFGWFVPLFRKHGSGMVAFILLIVQIVTGGFGTIFWAFFCNKNYIKKLLYIGYEPANEESKILLASKGLIDSSEIDSDKLPKKRNIVLASLIWIVKAVVLVSVLLIISMIIAEVFMN